MASYMYIHDVLLYSCCYAMLMPSSLVDWTELDKAGRYQGWRPLCMRRECQPTDLMVPTANPMHSIAYLRGAMIFKTCAILKSAIYVSPTSTDCS